MRLFDDVKRNSCLWLYFDYWSKPITKHGVTLHLSRCSYLVMYIYIFYHLHAVSRTQRGRQRAPSVKTRRSLLSVEFWKHCVLSGDTQHRAFPCHYGEKIKILINNNQLIPEWESNPEPSLLQSRAYTYAYII